MTTPQVGPSRGRTGSLLERRHQWSHRRPIGQMIGVEGLAVLGTGAVLLTLNWRGHGGATGPDILVQAVPGMAVAAVLAILGWIGWAVGRRRLRGIDVATALFLMVMSLLVFSALYVTYGFDEG